MTKNTYEKWQLPNYVNTRSVGVLAETALQLENICTAAIFGGLNQFYRGKKSAGKTQLMRDVFNRYFGGEVWGLWEEGRSDFKPAQLFESLNISLAKGQIANLPRIEAVYEDNKNVSYLIQSYKEQDGELKLSWKRINEEEKKTIETKYSITTADLKNLRNIHKKFFCIDEYNRCPEVVMNLFYGLMTGEINHDGEIIKLGNGFYSGIAASNPEDYAGTFNMDAAMWARYHIVLDFTAFIPTEKDHDILKQRNLSPKVQESQTQDLTDEIEQIHLEIKKIPPTLKERIILQYLQTGLNICSNDSIQNSNKEHLDWPRICSQEGCDQSTKICGELGGIDERAVRAVYRLAKGLEKVVKLKTGEKKEIDPLDSLLLAYKFVAPYKGVLNPKTARDRKGIEALAFEEIIPAIKTKLKAKIEKLEEIAMADALETANFSILDLRTEYKKKALDNEYLRIEQEIKEKFQEEKDVLEEELIKEFKSEIEKKESEILRMKLHEDIPRYTSSILTFIKQIPESYKNLINQKMMSEMTDREYAKSKYAKDKDYQTFKNEAIQIYTNNIELIGTQLIGLEENFMKELDPENSAKIQAIKTIRDENPNAKVKYIPEKKQAEYQKELRKNLTDFLIEKNDREHQQERDALFEKEWSFLKLFFDELKEMYKNQKR